MSEPLDYDERDYMFPELVARVFLDSQTARLARSLENSPRNVQEWLSTPDDAPPHAREFINEQIAVLNKLKYSPYLLLKGQCEEMLEAGLHPEAMASILSKLYADLTGKTIR